MKSLHLNIDINYIRDPNFGYLIKLLLLTLKIKGFKINKKHLNIILDIAYPTIIPIKKDSIVDKVSNIRLTII